MTAGRLAPADSTPPLHPALEPVASLLGTWEGDGRGEYPTIEPFGYHESVTIGHTGKPFLVYSQRTWATDDGRPLHVETGYWRFPTPGTIEVVLAHPTGISELAEGTWHLEPHQPESMLIELASTVVGMSASAKSVTAVARTLQLHADRLDYTLRMAAVGEPLTHHLAAFLTRRTDP